MTDDLLLREGLDLLVPAAPVVNEWPDVLARVSEGRPFRRWYRRARKRPVLALVILAVVVAIPVTAVAVTVKPSWPIFGRGFFSQVGLGPAKGTGVVLITQGTWDGQGWALTAYRSVRGSLCMSFTPLLVSGQPPRNGGGVGCGAAAGSMISGPHQARHELTIDWASGSASVLSNRRLLHYVIGDVVGSASEVVVTLGDGATIRTPTVPAPKALGLDVRFYAAHLPSPSSRLTLAGSVERCRESLIAFGRVSPTKVVGLSSGRVVAEMEIPIIRTFVRRQLSQCGRPYRNEFAVPAYLPAAARKLKVVEQVTAPYGATATVAVGGLAPIRAGRFLANGHLKRFVQLSRCWRVSFSDGESLGTCTPLAKVLNPDYWLAAQHAGRDTFLVIQAGPRVGRPVVRITFRLEDGRVLSKAPIDGIAVFAIPRYDLTTRSQHGFIVGYTAGGQPVSVRLGMTPSPTATGQIVYYRSCPPGSACYS